MIIVTLLQGTPEWLAFRREKFTASDASAMLGFSKYKTRDQLLAEKATGITEEITPAKQALFDRGHQAEAQARALIEEETDDDLFPVTGYHENLTEIAASLDGMTMDGEEVFEHKLWNEGLAELISTQYDLPDTHWPQVEQQLLVSGARRCRFVVSDGTTENRESIIYVSQPDRRQQVIDGWAQFADDLKSYTHKEPAAPAAIGNPLDSLPAPVVELTGAVTVNTLPSFKEHVERMLGAIKSDLVTDQDFADAEVAVKSLKKGEKQLAAAKDAATSKNSDIEEVFRTIDDVSEMMRKKRLEIEKLVKAQKESIRQNIVVAAQQSLADHIAKLPAAISVAMPRLAADFAGAIKGKKTVSSLQSAANDELARAKIEASKWEKIIHSNLEQFEVLAVGTGYQALFQDLNQLVLKPAADFEMAVQFRISSHKEAEAKRLEAQREQIRTEEEARIKREMEAKARAEAEAKYKAQAEELERTLMEDAANQADIIDVSQPEPTPVNQSQHQPVRTLADALRHYCRIKNLGEQDLGELLDIISSFEINLNKKAA